MTEEQKEKSEEREETFEAGYSKKEAEKEAVLAATETKLGEEVKIAEAPVEKAESIAEEEIIKSLDRKFDDDREKAYQKKRDLEKEIDIYVQEASKLTQKELIERDGKYREKIFAIRRSLYGFTELFNSLPVEQSSNKNIKREFEELKFAAQSNGNDVANPLYEKLSKVFK